MMRSVDGSALSDISSDSESENSADVDDRIIEVVGADEASQVRGFAAYFGKAEAISILRLSFPIFLGQVALFGMGVTTNMFLGRVVGPVGLAAGSLATSWQWTTSFLALAPTFGMDTLVSQAFGAKSYRLVGVIAQSALFVATLTSFVVAALWLAAKPALLALGQDPEVVLLAAAFLRVMLLALPPLIACRVLMRYLVNQGLAWPGLIANVFSLVVCVAANAFFLSWLQLGVEGAALANVVAWWANFGSMFAIMRWKGLHKKTWFGWTRESISATRLKSYLRYGVGGGAMIFFEVIGFEITTVFAGILGATALDAHTITLNLLLMSFSLALGLSEGTSARVGNLLGEGRPVTARRSSRTGMAIVLGCSIFNGSLFILLRNLVGRAYTDDPAVLELTASLIPISALLTLEDMAQTVLGGILRGAGKPALASGINLIGYYCVGVPIQAVLLFVFDKGVRGLWWALCIGLMVICTGYMTLYLTIDWTVEARKAIDRSQDVRRPSALDAVKLLDRAVLGSSGHSSSSEGADSRENVELESVELSDIDR